MNPKIIPIQIDGDQPPRAYVLICNHNFSSSLSPAETMNAAKKTGTELRCRCFRDVFLDEKGYGYRYMYAGRCPDCGQVFSFVSQIFREKS